MHNVENYDTNGIVGENSAGPLTTDTKANYDFLDFELAKK